ncbi:hypothetical protein Nmel_004452, partial [Mimus melanotis]
ALLKSSTFQKPLIYSCSGLQSFPGTESLQQVGEEVVPERHMNLVELQPSSLRQATGRQNV